MKKCFRARSVPSSVIMTYNGAYPGGRPPVSYSTLSNTPINVLALAFAQFKPQGGVDLSYLIGTEVVLDTSGISAYKHATAGIVLLSFGGGNTKFSMSVDPAT